MTSTTSKSRPKRQSFDADLSPESEVNQQAARDHNVRYDPKAQVYRDSDGYPVRDRFGRTF